MGFSFLSITSIWCSLVFPLQTGLELVFRRAVVCFQYRRAYSGTTEIGNGALARKNSRYETLDQEGETHKDALEILTEPFLLYQITISRFPLMFRSVIVNMHFDLDTINSSLLLQTH